jgi:hypothetical protein
MPFVTPGELITVIKNSGLAPSRSRMNLSLLAESVIFDAVVQASNITVGIFLHPQRVLRDDDGVA